MRDIKFKVWDKDEQEWVQLGGDTFIAYDGEKMTVIEGNEQYGYAYKNVEIVQSTGLTDKNGKEIYEGDIVLYDRNTNGRIDKYHFTVIWLEDRYCLENKDLAYVIDDVTWDLIEIIGNINRMDEPHDK